MSGMRYMGDGEWIPGVPARDLSDAEAAEFADLIEANARACGRPLYVADDSPGPGLTDIPGIGEKTEEALNAAGVFSLEGLANADPDRLDQALDGSNRRKVSGWQEEAKRLLQEGEE